MKRPRKLSYRQLDALAQLERNASLNRPWVDRFDTRQSTPTLDALVKRGYAEEISIRNEWSWFDCYYRITAEGCRVLAAPPS